MKGMVNFMKRILATLLAFSMLLSLAGNAYAERESNNEDLSQLPDTVAKIVFTKDGHEKTDNIARLNYSGKTELVGGKYGLFRDHSTEDGRHIQVATTKEWLYAPKGTTVEISIEYFDTGNGFFLLRYNGLNDKLWWEGFNTPWSETDKVTMTNSGTWKTHTFYIDDMTALKKFDGTDFQVSLWTHQHGVSPGDTYIRSITIEKIFAKTPIEIQTESGVLGNNFGPNENKVINAKLINTTEFAFKTKAKYRVCDYDGNELTGKVYKEGTFDFDIEPYGEFEYAFDVNDLSKFGVYRIYLDFEHDVIFGGEEMTAQSTVPIGFSIINKAEFHERNPVIGINTHAKEHGVEECAKLANYAGFYATRESIYWFVADPEADGTLTIPEEYREQFRIESEHGLKRLMLGTYGPTGYLDHEPYEVYHVPTSEKAHKAYADYLLYLLENLPDIDVISMWNEPSHFGFEVNPPEVYAQMIKTAYPIVKEKYPDIPIVGIGSAQCDLDLIEGVLKAGGGDYMDAVSFHPYYWAGGTYDLKWLEQCVNDVNDLFIKYTGKKKPIIIDEMGMHTDGALGGGSTKTAKYAEDEQAASYIKIFAAGRTLGWFEKVFYYDLIDDGMLNTTPEHNFGLVESSQDIPSVRYSAKPGFVQMAGLNKFMWDAEGVECVRKDGYWLCNFKKPNGENIAIVWTEKGSEANLDINLGAGEIEVFDMYTNSLGKMTSSNGVYTMALTRHPLYIKGNFTNFTAEKSSKGIALSYTATPDDAFSINYIGSKSANLRAECDKPDSIVVSEMNGTSIPVATTVEAGGNGYATLKLYEGDNLVYIAQPEITVEEAFMMDVQSEQATQTNSDYWHIVTTIQNSSNTKPISGTCRIIEINGEAVEREAEIFENLRPSETISLYLNLDKMVKKRNVNLKVEVALDNGYKKVVEKELDFTAAMYAKVAPKIDGVIEAGEWRGVWMTADTEDRVAYQNGDVWYGPNDLSLDGNLMWDEKYLYFGAVIKDDRYFNDRGPGELWAADSIQFGIENRVNKGDFRIGMGGTGGSNYTEVGIALLNGKTPAVYRWKTQDSVNPVGEVPNCELMVTRKGNKTYYELAIPWTELISPDYVLDPSEIFGFSMMANENDGTGRKGWIEYNSGIGLQKNTILFGKMKLIKE